MKSSFLIVVFFQMRIEGLQAVRDKVKQASHFERDHSAIDALGIVKEEIPIKKVKKTPDSLPNISSTSGCDLELCLVERSNDIETDFGMGNWLMDRLRVGVGQPVRYCREPHSPCVSCVYLWTPRHNNLVFMKVILNDVTFK